MRHLLVLSIAALCVAGCGKSPGERLAEAAIQASTGEKVDVSEDGGKITLQTDKGEMKISGGDGATLPAGFPQDVYLPADYKVGSAMEMPGAMVVSLETDGQMAAMAADASKRMQAQGWKQTMAMQSDGDNQMFVFEKDQRNATVSFSNDGETVTVGLQLSSKQ
jgi:ribosomal protein S6E (S10)